MLAGFQIQWEEPGELGARGGVEVFRRHHPDGSTELVIHRTDRGYDIDIEGIAKASVTTRDKAVSIRCYDADLRPIAEELLSNFILPHLAQLQGRPALHASAVAIDGRVVGFVGNSGMGKSTLATSFVGRSPLVTDDSLLLDVQPDGSVLAWPTRPRTRLLLDSLASVAPWPAEREVGDKAEVPLPGVGGPLPLARLYAIERSEGEISLVVLSARDALLALAAHLHRVDPTDAVLLAQEMEFLERIVRAIPIARLSFPRRFECLPDVRAAVERDLQAG